MRGRTPQRATRTGAWLAVVVCGAAMASGQPEPADPPKPTEPDGVGLSDPSVEEVVTDLGETDLSAPEVEPTRTPDSRPVRPGVGAPARDLPRLVTDDGRDSRRPMRERTFLVKERATLLRAETGEWVAVFHGGVDEHGEARPGPPAMVLLPSPTLENLETTASGRGLEVAYRLSGEVTRYHGRNYLMPTAFAAESTTTTPPPSSPTPPSPSEDLAPEAGEVIELGGGDGTASGATLDPSVDALIADLNARRNVAQGLARPPVESTTVDEDDLESPPGVLPALAREGDLLVRRRGRMTRLSGGEWAFVVDQDADGTPRALQETPLVLLPCRALMRMESAVRNAGDAMSFELTGRLTTYAGRLYVMPTLAVRMPVREGLSALQ